MPVCCSLNDGNLTRIFGRPKTHQKTSDQSINPNAFKKVGEGGRFELPKTLGIKKGILNIFWFVVSKFFDFHPYLGKIPILTNIFQRG